MTVLRVLLLTLVGLTLSAQVEQGEQVFRTTVNVVVAPTSVFDRSGNYITNLRKEDFRLLDNDTLQDINVDVAYIPISLVVAVQANSRVEAVLPQIREIAPVLEGLVYGEMGEAAILAFDHRLRVMQDFTSDSKLLATALDKVKPGSSSSRMIDAVMESVRLLRTRPANRRRILLLISETRDRSSEGRLRDALTEAQIHNVLVYSVNISRLITTLTAKTEAPRPDPIPPSARAMPGGRPATPNTVAQTYGNQGGSVNFIPLFVEIFKATKAIFVDNPVEVLTEYTGGRETSFMTGRGLEQALARIGEELHNQYMISYNPNNKMEAGYHEIQVLVPGRPDAKEIRTRPGYWLAAVQD